MSEDTSRIPISKRRSSGAKKSPESPKTTPKKEPAKKPETQEKKAVPKKDISVPKSTTSRPSSSSRTPLVIGILIALLLGVGLYYGMIVKSVKDLSRADVVLTSAQKLQIPVAKINGEKILYTDYIKNLEAMERFYESDTSGIPTPSDDDMSDYVLSRLVVNTLISQQARKLNATVSQETLDDVVENQVVANFENRETAEQEIMDRYGWDFDTFISYIIYPTELEKAVAKKYLDNQEPVDNSDVEAQAKDILEQIKEGADFAEKAAEYGSDATKSSGGDLGWFGRGAMVAPFEEAVFSLEAGQLGPELVETQFGYHIVQVDDRRTTTNEETGEEVEEVKARHILFATDTEDFNDFSAHMNEQLINATIEVLETVHNPFENLSGSNVDAEVVE